MNIFSSLKVYAGKWSVKSTRKFTSEEISAVSYAEVVPSKYGNSVLFNMVSGGTVYIKNGTITGTDDGIYEGTGLESSADLIKDWSGGYHSFFFWGNLCGKTGGKSRSEDKSGAGRDSDSSDGTSSHSGRFFPASD